MFSWCGYSLRFHSSAGWNETAFTGSMLRGAFGYSLKHVVCAMRLRDCTGCPLEYSCLYTTIFETRPAPEEAVMTRYDRAPHPFVLSVGLGRRERAENDSDLIFGLRLFGKACKAAPFILRAFEEAGARGLGGQRVPFRLEQIELEDVAEAHWLPGQSYPEPAERDPPTALSKHVKLIFLTPLRLMSNGRLCSPDNFDASAMAMALVRRVGLINTFFGDRESSMDFSTLRLRPRPSSLSAVPCVGANFPAIPTVRKRANPLEG